MTCVAAHDSSPTSPVGTGSPSLVLDPHLGAGDRDADRAGADVELLGRQVADPLALGLPVHGEQHRVVEHRADRGDARDRQRRAGVREQPQVRQVALGQALEVDEDLPHRRDAGEDRDLLVDDRLDDAAGEGSPRSSTIVAPTRMAMRRW